MPPKPEENDQIMGEARMIPPPTRTHQPMMVSTGNGRFGDCDDGPRYVNRRSDGPISIKQSRSKVSRNCIEPGSLSPMPFGRSSASKVTLKSPPMSTG